MPPQGLPRSATMQELFAEEIDENSYKIASEMTNFMLRAYRYSRVSATNIYPVTFFYITAIAHYNYNFNVPIIRNVRMLRESFIEDFKHEFHTKYIAYSAEGDLQIAVLWICAFSMNMCRYIHIHENHWWYKRATVKVLACFIGGERFRRDGNFARFEEQGNYFRDYNESLPCILETFLCSAPPNREP